MTAPPLQPVAMREPAARAVLMREFVFVSGKGGTGKTTVAAALGCAAAATGRRALVCDLTGSGRLAATFGISAPPHRETRLAQRLWAVSIDPDEALVEWLRGEPGGAMAAAVLRRSAAFSHFVSAAPGAKELITLGKAADYVTDLPKQDNPRRYDVVIADGPSTGHALGMLAAPKTLAEVARLGPVGEQARALRDFVADPRRTAYVGVALAEEMAVRETLDLDRGLAKAIGRRLDLVVVNGVYPDRFSDDDAEAISAAAEHSKYAPALRMVLAAHRHARVHAGRVDWLRRNTRAPVITLPFIFSGEVGPAEYEAFGRTLGTISRSAAPRPAGGGRRGGSAAA